MSYTLHVDLETRSLLDIKKVGLARYAASAQVIMCAWAIGDAPVQIWDITQGPFPEHLRLLIERPEIIKCAFNAAFERTILQHCLGIVSPIASWRDPSVMARYGGFPAHLARLSEFLQLGEQGKKKEGAALMRKFSFPKRKGGFTEPAEDPAAWEQYKEYCKYDDVAERIAYARLQKGFCLPPQEQELWRLDAKINERGIPVNLSFVDTAKKLVVDEQAWLTAELIALTGLENPNSPKQMLAWARARGYPYSSLLDKRVTLALAEPLIELDVVKALRLRKQTSKSSTAKLQALLDRTCADGNLRHSLLYYGAHTGRWSGRGVQLQNLPRVTVKDYDGAVAAVQSGNPSAVREHGNILNVVSSVIRACFQAPEGKQFLVSDLSAIENRVLGWMAGCEPILNVFREGRDPYIDFATKLYRKPASEITEHERQVAKSACLGCGYAMGGGADKIDKNGDEYKSGLWGYGEAMGIQMSQDEAQNAVQVFRQSYPEVQQLWYNLEDAAKRVVKNHTTEVVGCVTIGVVPDKVLWVKLPSGRRLHYLRPRLEKGKYQRADLTYETTLVGTKWGRKLITGGLLTENLVQAIARDVLAVGMLRADNAGLELVAHVHDELIAVGQPAQLPVLVDCMEGPMPWAPGLPLKAKGYCSKIYRK